MYIYEGHLGSLFATDDELFDTRCEMCGDSDWLLGYAETREEAWEILKDITNIDGSGGWDLEYVEEFLDEYFKEGDD